MSKREERNAAIEELALSPPVKASLISIAEEIEGAYQDRIAALEADVSRLRAIIAGALYHVQAAQTEGALSKYDISVERRVDDAEAILMGCRSGVNGEHPYDEHCVDPLAVSK